MKVRMSPRPFPVMMDYHGICCALRDEWSKLDPVDTSRPVIEEAGKAIETLCDDVEEREHYIRLLYASVAELVDGIENHGADKWMPHRVRRAVEILNKLGPSDES